MQQLSDQHATDQANQQRIFSTKRTYHTIPYRVFILFLLGCHIQFYYQYVRCCLLSVMILVAGLHLVSWRCFLGVSAAVLLRYLLLFSPTSYQLPPVMSVRPSVCLFVSTLAFKPADLWHRILHTVCMGHCRSLRKIECQGHRSCITVRVGFISRVKTVNATVQFVDSTARVVLGQNIWRSWPLPFSPLPLVFPFLPLTSLFPVLLSFLPTSCP